MVRAPLTLKLGAGFTAATIDATDECIAILRARSLTTLGSPIEVLVARADLSTRRLGRIPGNVLTPGTICGSRSRRRIFTAAHDGIWAFSLDDGSSSRLVGLPELPAATKGRPDFHWVLELDEPANRLFSLAGQSGAFDHLAEIDLASGSIVSLVPLPGANGGLHVDVLHRRIATPDDPRIFDFTGSVLAEWPTPEARFRAAALRPSGGAVVLEEEAGPLWLWNWANDRKTRIVDAGSTPVFGPDGTLFFMRNASSLWRLGTDGVPALIAEATPPDGFEALPTANWSTRPLVSADGRFLLGQLTNRRGTWPTGSVLHDAVVVDLVARRVQHVPDFVEYTVSWF